MKNKEKPDNAANDAVQKKTSKNQIYYGKGEERFNIVSHIVGAALAVIAAVLLVIKTSLNAGKGKYNYPALAITSASIFGVFLILMFLFSSLYHSRKMDRSARVVFRRLDHCAIPLLIAGTYAPFMLIGLVEYGTKQPADLIWGIAIASVVLFAAVLSVIFNALNPHKFRVLGMILYISMGWCVVIRFYHLMLAIGLLSGLFLSLGGIAYTAGILFYRKKKGYSHAIWHLFVIAGSVLHFVSVFFFLI